MALSGKTHDVFTGVSIQNIEKKMNITFNERTKVTLKKLTDEDIFFYLKKHKPYDKSGSYGVQGYFSVFVKKPSSDNYSCGGTNTDNGASGGTCSLFVRVLDDSFQTVLEEVSDAPTVATTIGQTIHLDFELTEEHVGDVLQVGFVNLASNYAPTGVFYDDFLVSFSPSSITQ